LIIVITAEYNQMMVTTTFDILIERTAAGHQTAKVACMVMACLHSVCRSLEKRT